MQGNLRVEADAKAADARIAELEADNTMLSAQIKELTKLVTELSEKLNQNSRNSHLHP